MIKILYISYDGLLEPLGQSQVLQYLKKLADRYAITIISYEKAHDWQHLAHRQQIQQETQQAGIRWIPLRYHKAPSVLATSYDLLLGILVGSYWIIRESIPIVHARSYVPAVIALTFQKIFRCRFIFDMRGFWADEKLDSGCWQQDSRIYHLAKWFERQFLLNAHCVVSLTYAGIEEIKRFPYMHNRPFYHQVIPTCTNLALFKPAEAARTVTFPDRPLTIGYVGTSSGWYLFKPVVRCYQAILAQYPQTRFLIVNRHEQAAIAAELAAADIPETQVQIVAAHYAEVPRYMAEMDASIFFIKPVFSKRASAPTKLGELLACGVPCLTNAGVGDVDTLLAPQQGIGIMVHHIETIEPPAITEAVNALVALAQNPQTRTRCIATAHQYFSLENGVEAYAAIYQQLAAT